MTAPLVRCEGLDEALKVSVVWADGVTCAPSPPALLEALRAAETAVRDDPARFPEATRAAVRDALRKQGYKPTGRGKPASEYLLGVAREAGLPRINNLVDIINLASLESALPISMLDRDRLGEPLCLRIGRKDEPYVFNVSGQSMDVAGLPVVARGEPSEAVGNAVKDAMACKVSEHTTRVLAFVYGSRALPEGCMHDVAQRLERLFREHAGATATGLVALGA